MAFTLKYIFTRHHVNQIFTLPEKYDLRTDLYLIKTPEEQIFGKRPKFNNIWDGLLPLPLQLGIFHCGECRIYKRNSSLEESPTQLRGHRRPEHGAAGMYLAAFASHFALFQSATEAMDDVGNFWKIVYK